ncbi:hypothetical protein PCANC_21202 [Puccinia coronata f. sp. avenae]|uniref:Uncharacterized protein n=1 Tax=Puccinia coronata f. sp. avenae TaxID=200324 RepID=A0A2N5TYA6_9BASI|nr:hypothetical protein PCANC_21202 [Puccinia coronata f. sp. avenae]
MPVNWTSGKAKLAKKKFKKWSKKPRKVWNVNGNDSKKGVYLHPRRPIAKSKLLAQSAQIVRQRLVECGAGLEKAGSRRSTRERIESTQVDVADSEPSSVGHQDHQPSSSDHQTTTSNHQFIDIESKRRVLLAQPDWAGIDVCLSPPDLGRRAHPLYNARLVREKKKALTEVTPPERAPRVHQTNERECTISKRFKAHHETSSHSNLRHIHILSFSPSSRDDPIVSPTPTSPRVKKPTKRGFDAAAQNALLAATVPGFHKEIGHNLSRLTCVQSNLRSSAEKNESKQETSSDDLAQPLAFATPNRAVQTASSHPQVPPWICRVSEALGFSPPTEMGHFHHYKQSVPGIDSHHSLMTPPMAHEATPDLDLFLKSNSSRRSSGYSEDHYLTQDEVSDISNTSTERQESSLDNRRETRSPEIIQESGREELAEEQEEYPKTSFESRVMNRSLFNNQPELTPEPQHRPEPMMKTSSDCGWRNLFRKSNNDQFELLFQNRNDDERIF